MKILDNTKITTKIITLLEILGVLTVAVAWIGSRELLKSDAVYSDLTNDLSATVVAPNMATRLH